MSFSDHHGHFGIIRNIQSSPNPQKRNYANSRALFVSTKLYEFKLILNAAGRNSISQLNLESTDMVN